MKRFEHIIKWMKRCGRRHMVELDGHSGRGPVGDQLRAILAKEAFKLTTEKLFKKWDADGEGSVSRKEFRTWWPKIGYEAPAHDINELFDEFDVDGSGESAFPAARERARASPWLHPHELRTYLTGRASPL
jgi:hypothetical protein